MGGEVKPQGFAAYVGSARAKVFLAAATRSEMREQRSVAHRDEPEGEQ